MDRRELLKTLPALAATPFAAAFQSAGGRRALLRPALCAYSFREQLQAKTMTYEDLVRLCADLGLDGLDSTVYWFPSTADEFLLPLKRLAYKLAVEIYSISVRTEMTQPTPEARDKETGEIRRWVDVASKLGAGHIRVFGGRVPKGATEEQAANWAAEVLKRGAEFAAQKGVVLGLENHGGITEKAETIVRIVKQVDSPWVGINLDTGNFRSNALPQIEICLPHAVNVQVKAERQDWDTMLRMIASSGYRGYLALEYEAKEPAPAAVPRLLGKLKELCAKYSSMKA